jgi:outer membrane protein assembly factor BamB
MLFMQRQYRFWQLVAAVSLIATTTAAAHAESNWPSWRGPAGSGHSADDTLPVKWTDANVVWKTQLVGSGQSSPTVWGQRIFLTSSTENGSKRNVMCLDRATGKLLWNHVAWTGEPEKTHAMNQFASATCATDGKYVIAFFGKGGIHCYDFSGELIWSRDLGQFAGPWGAAASPIIVGDIVIQNCDSESDACLIGLNKKTGDTIWKTSRENLRGWCSPILIESGNRTEVVLNGELGVSAYDPKTGKSLWFCKGDRGRGTPTVATYKDLLIAVAGRPGDMIAVKSGGSGTVNSTHEVWRTNRKTGRDLPSPIVVGEYLLVVNLRPGTATCYEAATGKQLDQIRLSGGFSASPIAAGGLVYIPNENGEVFVLKPGTNLEIVARNKLSPKSNEVFRASLTPHDGQILCRSDKVLYCIGPK